MANKWLDENKYKMSMEAVSTEETQWLFRRIAYREPEYRKTIL